MNCLYFFFFQIVLSSQLSIIKNYKINLSPEVFCHVNFSWTVLKSLKSAYHVHMMEAVCRFQTIINIYYSGKKLQKYLFTSWKLLAQQLHLYSLLLWLWYLGVIIETSRDNFLQRTYKNHLNCRSLQRMVPSNSTFQSVY